MSVKVFATSLMIFVGAAEWADAAIDALDASVTVDKVVYEEDSTGKATVRIQASPSHAGRFVARTRLEFELDGSRPLPDVVIDLSTTNEVVIPFTVPPGEGGCGVRVRMFEDDHPVGEALDVFAVGDNPFRLGQQASTGRRPGSQQTAAV